VSRVKSEGRTGVIVGLSMILFCLSAFLSPSALGADGPAADNSRSGGDYVLGVEDRLAIRVWGEEDLNMEVIVRPDGMITFPLVGDVPAAGRTPRALAKEIEDKLKVLVKDPLVTVVVLEINSFKVYLLGEFRQQGVQTIRSRIKLLQVVAMAGGLTEFADKTNLVLIREVGGRETRMRIDYRKLINGALPELNMEIKPGDILLATN